ncbi:heavy-metal-associated domain-containing protein [Paenibacillus paeoniae]|uniref:HMA domain-containing protein n=1 Tax=Paenibacillus paeoniae TaxID=2292705 RepID=A0A371PH60_9BACL|nr:cation transporter [Paenibacillus paeoniae]REK75576.1 hypothetical protein DX130_00325 [Paenibacillus paeoniae]
MTEPTVQVQGMTCRSCVARIESSINEIRAEGHVNFEQGTIEVRFDADKVQIFEIEEAIRKKGYNVQV